MRFAIASLPPVHKALAAAGLAFAALSGSGLSAADDEFIIGATTHFGHNKGIVSENLRVFKDSGMLSPRDDTSWGGWERQKGVYTTPQMYGEYLDEAVKQGLSPLQIVGYGHQLYDKGYPKSPEAAEGYAKFAEYIVSKYKGKCHLYQMWNEWDGGCGMGSFKGEGDAQSYVRLAVAAYPKMKAVDPSITVIANSVCTGEKFLEDTLKEGVLKHCDGIAFHAYNYGNAADKRTAEAFVERIAGIDKLLKSYNDGKAFPIYITEIGWPNYIKRGGSTDPETGDILARTLLLAKTIPAIKGLWWYDFQDDGLDPEYNEDNFGIVRTDLTPKEPYYVLRSIAEIVRSGKFVERVATGSDDLIVLKFKMPDSKDVLAAWSLRDDSLLQVTLKNGGDAKGNLKTFFAGFDQTERAWGAREWADINPYRLKRDVPLSPDKFQFTVKSRPYIIVGDLSSVSVETVKLIPFPDIQRQKHSVVKVPAQIGMVFPDGAAQAQKTVNFGGPTNYRSLSGAAYSGTADLDASYALTWDKDSIKLVVEVSDNVFFQNASGADTWNGDSVQVAFQNLAKDASHDAWTEYTLALTDKGPAVYREFSQIKLPEGQSDGVSLDVKRNGSKTVYTAKFPLKELGFAKLEPDMLFGFSLLVNDNDGSGRKGYLHWGDGIGSGKDPSEYNWILLKE